MTTSSTTDLLPLRYLFNFVDHSDRDAVYRVSKRWRSEYLWVDGECAYMLALAHGNIRLAGELWSFSGPFLSLEMFRHVLRRKQYDVIPQFTEVYGSKISGNYKVHNLYVIAIANAIDDCDSTILSLLLPTTSPGIVAHHLGRAANHALVSREKGRQMFAAFCKSRPDLLQIFRDSNYQSRERIECFVNYYDFDTVFPFIHNNWRFFVGELACKRNDLASLQKYKESALESYHGKTCLEVACLSDAFECVQFLLASGVPHDGIINSSILWRSSDRVKELFMSEETLRLRLSLKEALVSNNYAAFLSFMRDISRSMIDYVISLIVDTSLIDPCIIDALVEAAVVRMDRPHFGRNFGALLEKRHVALLLDNFRSVDELREEVLDHCSIDVYVELFSKSRRFE